MLLQQQVGTCQVAIAQQAAAITSWHLVLAISQLQATQSNFSGHAPFSKWNTLLGKLI